MIPEIIILSSLSIVIVADLFLNNNNKYLSYYFLQITLFVTLSYLLSMSNNEILINELYDSSVFSIYVKIFLILLLIIVFSYSYSYLKNFEKYKSEYFMIIIFGLLGMMIMVSSNHLLLLYLGIELLSLALYTIIAYNKDSLYSAEAAVKYYILGAMSSGFLLFGISLIYGLTGTLLYEDIVNQITSMSIDSTQYSINSIGLIFALTFILISIAFKFGAAPFHMWLPDVYQGSLTPTTLMLSTIPKVAIFIVMIKLTNSIFSDLEIFWSEMVLILSVFSILVGNLIAIVQTNIKRLLAYSTIANVGFILLGIYTGPTYGYSAALFYTITYTLFTTAVFGLLCELKIDKSPIENIKDLSGLNYKYPSLAVLFLIIMLSMIGIPPFLGFYAKFYIIQSLIIENHINLAVFAVIMTVIGSFYYLRVIKVIYFDELDDKIISISSHLISYVLVLSLVIIGLFPNILSSLAFYSIKNL
tara:strand:+ start:981 stop:2399 length:1419 start_codon:yes stop_codon:yes gene_type:complete